jgi:hypothetical protein
VAGFSLIKSTTLSTSAVRSSSKSTLVFIITKLHPKGSTVKPLFRGLHRSPVQSTLVLP